MREIALYLEAIDATTRAKRACDGLALVVALKISKTIWEALPPNLREGLAPPPIHAEWNYVLADKGYDSEPFLQTIR